MPGRGEPSGNDSVTGVIEPYQAQGFVLRNAREAVLAAAYIRALVAYRDPAALRRWTARQAGYDHDRAVEATVEPGTADGLPRQLMPTRHGILAHLAGQHPDRSCSASPAPRRGDTPGTVHSVVGGWIAYAPGRATHQHRAPRLR